MPKRRNAEQIVTLLRQIGASMAQGICFDSLPGRGDIATKLLWVA
jgi:hypothetical protein